MRSQPGRGAKTGPPEQIEIHLVGGAPHIRSFDVDGNQHLRPLRRRRINKRVNKKDGTFRLSAEYDVIGDDGTADGYVRIRLDQTTEDKLTGYNRPEHLRAFPETDSLFRDVQHQLRASAESANRVSMLAWQAYRNAQAEHVFTTPQAVDAIGLQQTA